MTEQQIRSAVADAVKSLLQEVRRPGDVLLAIDEVMRRTSLGRTAIHELEAGGDFPKRVQVTRNRVAWRESEVEAWILSRPRARATEGRGER